MYLPRTKISCKSRNKAMRSQGQKNVTDIVIKNFIVKKETVSSVIFSVPWFYTIGIDGRIRIRSHSSRITGIARLNFGKQSIFSLILIVQISILFSRFALLKKYHFVLFLFVETNDFHCMRL